MPRMRTLKPEFWSDKRMVRLSPYARLFYMGMWNFSICHNGHLDDDAEELKLKILPLDDVDPDQLLKELMDIGRVKRCIDTGDGTYLWIPTLTEHQNIDPRWKPRCRYCAQPVPPVLAEPQQTTYEEHRGSASHIQGRDGMGQDGKNTPSPTPPASATDGPTKPPRTPKKPPATVPDDDPDFVAFWAAYPKRVGKLDARKAWAKVATSGADVPALIRAAEAFAGQCARNRTEARFIPHPATWLNGERWNDQRPVTPANSDGAVPWWDA